MRPILFSILALIYACGLVFGFTYATHWYLDWCSSIQNKRLGVALWMLEHQFNNIVHVATTNKPELIADRFIRRPGRFDLVIGVHAPTRETRQAYLDKICNGHLTPKQTSDILDKTEGLSLAYLREIASTYLVLGLPLEETIARLQAQAKQKFTSSKTGFTIGYVAPERD